MSEMLERCAAAIAERRGIRQEVRNYAMMAVFRMDARAALEAMREPLEPMIRVGSAAIEDTDLAEVSDDDVRWWGQPWGPCALAAWCAMIDEALRIPLPTEAPTASATGRAADHSGVAGLLEQPE